MTLPRITRHGTSAKRSRAPLKIEIAPQENADAPASEDSPPDKIASRRNFLTALGAAGASLAVRAQEANAGTTAMGNERFARGLDILRKVGGENFDGPVNSLAEVSADLARFTVEYPYGDVLSRPGLALPLRQLCTAAMLLADGSAQPQLKYHMAGYLNVGGEPRVLIELMFVSVALLGFPPTINAVGLLRSIFAERKLAFVPVEPATDDGTGRAQNGSEAASRLTGGDMQAYFGEFEKASPDLARLSVEFAFGEALSRQGLDFKAKALVIVAMLAAGGNHAAALRQHIQGALALGITRDEVVELLMQVSVYRGFPCALNAFAVAKEAFGDTAASQPISFRPANAETRQMRLERGRAALGKTSGASGDAVVRSFDDIAPDLGRMIVEHSYGEIFSRTGIDARTRELTACAALAAVGSKTAETPLRVHINAALNVGASRDEILETLLNLAPYSGYPAVQQAVRIAAEEFGKRG
jgi:4-carboxymuconolactone decarboxylase